MTAASEAREALEAAAHQAIGETWRSALAYVTARGGQVRDVPLGSPDAGARVAVILARADTYAAHLAADEIDKALAPHRLREAAAGHSPPGGRRG